MTETTGRAALEGLRAVAALYQEQHDLLAAAARAAAKDLTARFPSSELARAAPTLIIDLDGDGDARHD